MAEYAEPDPRNSLETWLDTVLPHPLICALFCIIAIFAKWEFILRVAVALAFCFGCVGVGLVFEWFRARNWKEWQEFDEDGEYDSSEDEDEDEEEGEDEDGVKEENRY
ncbi:hypothetical protein N431DRAFT_557180 [Stipitochalara longipes BDJ]|nr:hypothetical protein N431DRAFT_557180 [Stipitochalara longipes BDJ]